MSTQARHKLTRPASPEHALIKHSKSILEEDAIARHRQTLKELFPIPEPEKPRRSSKTASVLGLLAMAIGGLIWADPAYRSEAIVTAIGVRQSTILADGSQLTLNTNTRADVEWHIRSRRVVLHQGQAMFEVSHTQYRPFYVLAGKTTVKVVGTVFDVLRQQDDVTVTVLQGKVMVSGANHPGTSPTFLLPGQQTVSHAGNVMTPIGVDTASSTAWKDGRLVFERTPLTAVLAEIQRYRSSPVLLRGQSAGQLQLSGVFDIDHTDTLLQLLPKILPVKVWQTPDGSVIVSAK